MMSVSCRKRNGIFFFKDLSFRNPKQSLSFMNCTLGQMKKIRHRRDRLIDIEKRERELGGIGRRQEKEKHRYRQIDPPTDR